jgi:acetylornithine aminotransferase
MKLFDVYPLQQITPVKGKGSYLFDEKGEKYLDLYGGHAVISIGHSDPRFTAAISDQVATLGFYSNSVQNPLQQQLATKLGELSGYEDYELFLVNSGAEAIENAVKLASFHNGRRKIVALTKGFHGRTSLAAAITEGSKMTAPVNENHQVSFVAINDLAAIEKVLAGGDISAVIIEGIQGIAGIYEPTDEYLTGVERLCKQYGTLLILDEIQSGFGRTGKFFAHQYSNVKPDLITIAKGMANGFPAGGVIINPKIKSSYGLLGTTFGGTHLICRATLAVLEVLEDDKLIENAAHLGGYLQQELAKLPDIEVRGKGLMIGIEFSIPIKPMRQKLLQDYHIFTGVANNPNVLRILPPLCLSFAEADYFLDALKKVYLTEAV